MSRLGRGLDSLIKDMEKPVDGQPASVKVEQIKPNRYQPRRHFDPVKLNELAESIKENGLILPIIICKLAENEYELIAGERRLEACKIAGVDEIPVFIKNVTDRERLVWAIIENVQRENLTALEEAKAYTRLIDEFELTHADISKIMSKDRATITNTLRLLKLSDKIQDMLEQKLLTPAHCRAILTVAEDLQETFAQEIIKKNYTVKKAEEEAQKINSETPKEKPQTSKKTYEKAFLRDVETKLAKSLNSPVKIKEKRNAVGEVVITFTSIEELEKITDSITNKT